MGMPGMHGGPGMGPFGDEDQGPFREEDDGAGGMGSLAMGMDVDISTASTSTDKREAERQRGRDSRYVHCVHAQYYMKIFVTYNSILRPCIACRPMYAL